MKYEEWLQEWICNYVKITAKQRTYTRYSEIINRHIGPNIGNRKISDLTAMDLQKFIAELLVNGNKKTGKGLSSSAVNSIITVIQSSFSVAYGLGIIENNPSKSIKRPKVIERRIECFSVAEQRDIEKTILSDSRLYMIGIIVCLYTGLRIGELLALTWQDIDFSNSTLSVTKTCYDGKNVDGNFGRIVDAPKTASSQRVIPLPKQIKELLKNMKRQCNSEWVITKRGELISVRTYQRNFSALLDKLHLGHRGFHALRHTFATRAIECGMDVRTLSEILGHKNPTITLNRYAHSLMEHKRNMMNKIGQLYELSQNKRQVGL